MAVLNVNIDHVATVRQARRTDEPDPVWAAAECELAGANGITMHLRQDRRHINDRDVWALKESVASKFNLEMSMAEPIVKIAEQVVPDQVTLVPENRQELTTEGGLDCVRYKARLREVVRRMHKKGILVSAFITPEQEQIAASAETGCDAVELHTGGYANAKTDRAVKKRIADLEAGRDFALEHGSDRPRRPRADVSQHRPDRSNRGFVRVQYRPQYRVACGLRRHPRSDPADDRADRQIQ